MEVTQHRRQAIRQEILDAAIRGLARGRLSSPHATRVRSGGSSPPHATTGHPQSRVAGACSIVKLTALPAKPKNAFKSIG